MEKQCPICNMYFIADEAWKKICLDCWIRNKKQEEEKSHSKQEKKAYRRREEVAKAIPDDMLKTPINLCHPDRHSGKDSATRATQYLLSLRGKS